MHKIKSIVEIYDEVVHICSSKSYVVKYGMSSLNTAKNNSKRLINIGIEVYITVFEHINLFGFPDFNIFTDVADWINDVMKAMKNGNSKPE